MAFSAYFDYSIILFTYNPHIEYVKRIIRSLENIHKPIVSGIEYIIIDNNSTNNWIDDLSDELACLPFQIINEKRQGLTYSRIRGFGLAKGEWIVCVDDDNELYPDYLTGLHKLVSKYPQVGVWGPGKIKVEFHQDTPAWAKNYKIDFQEKNFQKTRFGKECAWMSYYPPGTGMCLHKDVAQAYLANIKSGKMTATDRKGNSLSSGGDSQVVYSGILIEKEAGVSPNLRVNHLIGPTKTNLDYIKRLNFGVFSCWPVHIEVFPEMKDLLKYGGMFSFIKYFFKLLVKSRLTYYPYKFQIPLAKELAVIYAFHKVNVMPLPLLYRILIKTLKLQ